MTPVRVTLDTNDLVRHYLAGETSEQMAARFGVSWPTIYRRLRDAGVTRTRSEAARLRDSKLTPAQRRHRAQPAHDAKRGRPNSDDALRRGAIARQQRGRTISDAERELARLLSLRGHDPVAQQATGPYNIDLALPPVAVEVFGGNWHAHGLHVARIGKRTRHLLDRGWHLYFVWITHPDPQFLGRAADDLIAYSKRVSRDPAASLQYRVIRRDAYFTTTAEGDAEDLPFVPPAQSAADARAPHASPAD